MFSANPNFFGEIQKIFALVDGVIFCFLPLKGKSTETGDVVEEGGIKNIEANKNTVQFLLVT